MRAIKLDENNKVIGVKESTNDFTLDDGFFVSEIGAVGQIMQSDGTFINIPTPAPAPTPSIEDKVNYLYYKSKGLIV